MKKKIIFKGAATALVTPFSDDKIDFGALMRLIDMQIAAGISALVIAGTTGEGATLSPYERQTLFEAAREMIGGRCPLILGTGSNDTRTAIEYTRLAASLGADAALVVTPYYNRGTEDGLVSHYKRIAESADIPIIIYNVPSRTGVNISHGVLSELVSLPNVCGIKEASDSAERLSELSAFGDELPLYAGNDSQICQVMAVGGMGVVSVASNVIPKRIGEIVDLCLECNYKLANEHQKELLPFIKSLFLDTNPAPIKYILSELGYIAPELRLPMALPPQAVCERIKTVMAEIGNSKE